MKLMQVLWSNRKAVLTVTLLLCVAGAYFAANLPVAIFPQLTTPRIVISAGAGDLPIASTLAQVTRPLEAAVSTVPGVIRVVSTTINGSAGLDVTFAWETDMTLALQRVHTQIDQARPSMAADVDVTAELMDPSIFPIMGYSLSSDKNDLTTLRRTALYAIRPRLARLPGVAQIRVTGGDDPEYVVSARPQALASRGLALEDLRNALAKANDVQSAGSFDSAYQRYEVMVTGQFRGPADIGAVTLARAGADRAPILVSDVADVSEAPAPRTVLATGNGAPSVIVNIIKQPSANTLQVASEVKNALRGLGSAVPPDTRLALFYDQSRIVMQSESSVVEAVVIGGVLALGVLIAFLGDARAAGIVLALLPLSLLISFVLMRLMGQTLNIMTLGALAIALGLVIDDGIVVVENIVHEIEGGSGVRRAVATGARAITPAMIGSSLTTMAAFLPLTLLSGVTGQFFAPLALVMICALAVSLILSLTLGPLMAVYLLRPRPPARRPGAFDRIANGYERLLSACLKGRWIVLLSMVPLLIASYIIFTQLETGFFPEFDEGAFVIDYQMPPGTSLSETDRICRQAENILARQPDVASWSRLTGARSGSGLELTDVNQGDILVRLKERRRESAEDVMSDVRGQIAAALPALQVDLAQMLQDGIGDIAGSPSPIEVKIYGDDMGKLASLAHIAGNIVSGTPGVVDENDGVVQTGPQMSVRVDSLRAARYGVAASDVASDASTAIRGSIATTVQRNEETIGVRVRADMPTPTDIASLSALPVAAANGATAPLGSMARIEMQPGSDQITREDQQQMVAVTAGLENRDLGSAVRDVQQRLEKSLPLPAGYRIEYGGLYASQQASFVELATVLGTAVLLVGFMLILHLRSFRQAVVLIATAVLSLSGVLAGLWLTSTPLNISSFTGAIMIVGIVTENGIVLFDFVNQLRRDAPGRPFEAILREAGKKRLRPILMTTIGTILALLPLTLGIGAGAAMQKPLAIAVIGGLCGSTFFTLAAAPALLLIAETLASRHPSADIFLAERPGD